MLGGARSAQAVSDAVPALRGDWRVDLDGLHVLYGAIIEDPDEIAVEVRRYARR